MCHTVVKLGYTNMKNQFEISWKFPAHPPPQRLRNYNEQAKTISFQIAQARNEATGTYGMYLFAFIKPSHFITPQDETDKKTWFSPAR